eukprot:1162087-Pelagomonas_calceolata.AAC.20
MQAQQAESRVQNVEHRVSLIHPTSCRLCHTPSCALISSTLHLVLLGDNAQARQAESRVQDAELRARRAAFLEAERQRKEAEAAQRWVGLHREQRGSARKQRLHRGGWGCTGSSGAVQGSDSKEIEIGSACRQCVEQCVFPGLTPNTLQHTSPLAFLTAAHKYLVPSCCKHASQQHIYSSNVEHVHNLRDRAYAAAPTRSCKE